MALTRVGNPTTLTTIGTNFSNNNRAALELLDNGNLVATFQSGIPGQPVGSGESLMSAIVLNQTGGAVSALQSVQSASATQFIGGADVVSNADGSFVLVWDREVEDGGPSAGDVFGQAFTAAGTATGPTTFSLTAAPTDGEFDTEAVRLSNGNVLTLWSDVSQVPALDANIAGRIFTSAGTAVAGDFVVNATSADIQTSASAVKLTDGRVVVAWVNSTLVAGPEGPDLSPTSISARFLDAAGAPSGADVNLVAPPAGFRPNTGTDAVDLVALSGGGFAMVWSEDNGDLNPTSATANLKLQIFDAAGAAVGAATTVKQRTMFNTTFNDDAFTSIELMPMPDGNLAIYWQDWIFGGVPVAHLAVHTAAGAQVLGPTNLETIAQAGDVLSVEVLPNGQVMALTQFNSGNSLTYQTVLLEFTQPGSEINGTPGDDPSLVGTANADTINGLAGNDVLYGLGSGDQLNGGDGNDLLDGGTGADVMVGGNDNDQYVVDNSGDSVDESATTGFDTVYSSVSFTLGANVEQLLLTGGTAGLTAAGNNSSNVLYGNLHIGGVTLLGFGGDDVFYGSNYADTIDGGANNDILQAFYSVDGVDTLIGGSGDDVYYTVETGDLIIEQAGGGFDTVYAQADTTLSTDVEQLLVYGGATVANGNASNNNIFGNNSSNSLSIDGGNGNDVIYGSNFSDIILGGADNDQIVGYGGTNQIAGGAGSDIIYSTSATDVIIELAGGGFDTLYANYSVTTLAAEVEQLISYGGATVANGNGSANGLYGLNASNALSMDGGAGADTIYGSTFADVINGGADGDYLYGLGGADRFTYGTAGNMGQDVIVDFADGSDTIDLTGRGYVAGSIGGDILISALPPPPGLGTDVSLVNFVGGSLAGTTILMMGISQANITSADFLF